MRAEGSSEQVTRDGSEGRTLQWRAGEGARQGAEGRGRWKGPVLATAMRPRWNRRGAEKVLGAEFSRRRSDRRAKFRPCTATGRLLRPLQPFDYLLTGLPAALCSWECLTEMSGENLGQPFSLQRNHIHAPQADSCDSGLPLPIFI